MKDRLALERARNLSLVILDKTGTLTRGAPAVSGVVAAAGTTEDDLISRAAAVESNSEHPLAKAIVAAAGRRSLTRLAVSFEALPGRGAKVVRSDPRDVVGAIELSRATYRKMIQNLVWATAYNIVAVTQQNAPERRRTCPKHAYSARGRKR